MLEESLSLFVRLVVGGLVLAGLWYAMRPQRVFTIRVERGNVRSARGTVTRSFVQEVESICRQAAVTQGWVHGLRRGRSIILSFSGSIPADCRQHLRNLWQMQGSLR
jgi:hypothetical protein